MAFLPADITRSTRQYTHSGRLYKETILTPPNDGPRQPITLLAIVDTSGSMAESVAVPGTEAGAAFSRLDLVKHALRTCIEVLEPQDSLGIISFNSDARVILGASKMTRENKGSAQVVLESMAAGGGTNMWEGIRVAAQLANDPMLFDQNIVALLLTDGYPSTNPPRGLIPSLQTMIHLKTPWTLHTFGFGYSLDSKLLYEIAEWGHGLFGFIPDATMVGTVFINFLATVLSTAAVDPVHGIIQYGQQREVVELSGADIPTSDEDPSTAVTVSQVRCEYMNTIQQALAHCLAGRVSDAQAVLTEILTQYASHASADVAALLRDISSPQASEGQIGMAPAHFERWGAHYMRAYLRAQQLQMCMNFKDPGLQLYGGDMFKSIQATAERIFCDLPPPRPTAPVSAAPVSAAPVSAAQVSAAQVSAAQVPSASGYGGYGAIAAAVAATFPMRIFHNQGGGCFHGDCKVLLADGTQKPICNLQAGEFVKTPYGMAEVLAVVVCNQYAQSQPMSKIGSLLITPWHPVRDADGNWYFPADRHGYQDHTLSTVYNIVLAKHHIVYVEGVEAITLGHGLTGPVVSHNYLGTTAVIEDLNKQPGMEYGRPTYTNLVAIRDPESGLIVRWEDRP